MTAHTRLAPQKAHPERLTVLTQCHTSASGAPLPFALPSAVGRNCIARLARVREREGVRKLRAERVSTATGAA